MMRVLKFGGSSLADFKCLRQVQNLILSQSGDEALIVLSAPGGMTDQLVELAALAEQGVSYEEQWQALESRAKDLHQQVVKLYSAIAH